MKEGPEEAKGIPLELLAAAMEEERENKGVASSFVITESIF
jgi:hypothetical protein